MFWVEPLGHTHWTPHHAAWCWLLRQVRRPHQSPAPGELQVIGLSLWPSSPEGLSVLWWSRLCGFWPTCLHLLLPPRGVKFGSRSEITACWRCHPFGQPQCTVCLREKVLPHLEFSETPRGPPSLTISGCCRCKSLQNPSLQ